MTSSINSVDDSTLKHIFKECKNIAIVGLSPDASKPSHKVAKFLQSKGYKIIPIYPKEDIILGEKAYRTLKDVKERVDMVDMFRKASFADDLVQSAKARGDVKCFWIQLGITNDDAVKKAIKYGMIAVQNRCTKIEYERLR